MHPGEVDGMATSPYLVREDDTWKLDISIGASGRRRFELTDRAESLLVDDCEYDNRDVVPWVTAKALVTGGDAYLDSEDYDAFRMTQRLTGADGGREADDHELRVLGEHILSQRYGKHERGVMQEHVKRTALAAHVDPWDIKSKEERVKSLQDIARDLE
jgi:hypothetical protein